MATRNYTQGAVGSDVQGPPLTVHRQRIEFQVDDETAVLSGTVTEIGQYTLWPGASAVAIMAEVAQIEREKPKAPRKPRQFGLVINGQSLFDELPVPKKAPGYIGRNWSFRKDYEPRDSANLFTETIGGEPWPEAYARMKAIADAIGWQSWGAKPGDEIPATLEEARTWQHEWKAA